MITESLAFQFASFFKDIKEIYRDSLIDYIPHLDIYLNGISDFSQRPSEKYESLSKEQIQKDLEITDNIELLIERIKRLSVNTSAGYLEQNINYLVDELVDGKIAIYTAIAQIDLERPGFIDDFPEAYKYVIQENYEKSGNRRDMLQCRDFYKMIKGYNRYSKKFDMKCIKNRLGIKNEDLIVKESSYYKTYYRVDDFIALNLEKFIKENKNKRIYNYLVTNFIEQKDTLLPKDYRKIIENTSLDVKYPDKLPTNPNSLEWIDIYFSLQDSIMENLDSRKVKPEIMKLINKIKFGDC